MSKSSRRKKAERKLASKMGNYNTMNGKTGIPAGAFIKPGSKQIPC